MIQRIHMISKNKKQGNNKPDNTFEKNKFELVSLRIKNKYYNRSDVLEKVITEIVKKELLHNP